MPEEKERPKLFLELDFGSEHIDIPIQVLLRTVLDILKEAGF